MHVLLISGVIDDEVAIENYPPNVSATVPDLW
jgi:hypothetical protein